MDIGDRRRLTGDKLPTDQGMAMTIDGFVGREQFGTRIQPLLRRRETYALAA